MLNIHDLERRWLKYKLKHYAPIVLGGIFTLIILTIGIVLVNDSTVKTETAQTKIVAPQLETKVVEANITKKTTISPKIEQVETINVPQNTVTVEPVAQPKGKLILKPSLRFMDNIEDSLNHYYIPDEPDNLGIDESNHNIQEVKAIKKVVSKPVVEVEQKSDTKQNLSIIRHEDKTDLSDVIRRFKKNKNPTLSLFIAKKYYSLGEYQKSYNYALMTNEIDKNIEESWLIFAKSLVKLGQHELAIATLKSYTSSSNSTSAKALLGKIQSGEFR